LAHEPVVINRLEIGSIYSNVGAIERERFVISMHVGGIELIRILVIGVAGMPFARGDTLAQPSDQYARRGTAEDLEGLIMVLLC
jgi:hypothetical protein